MIAQTIQLALAPVFVLVAVGQILNALSLRLGRIIDRSRELQKLYGETTGTAHDMVVTEIRYSDRRIALVSNAISSIVMCSLSIGFTVALLFVEEIAGFKIYPVVMAVFLFAIALMMWALIQFLREIRISTEVLRIPRDFLELDL